jgi:hypothetical protein
MRATMGEGVTKLRSSTTGQLMTFCVRVVLNVPAAMPASRVALLLMASAL